MSHNAVTGLQDRRGFMWLGTRDGLNRYDGYESGPTTAATAIVEDRSGNLWIGTDGDGLFRLPAGADTAFQRFAHGPRSELGLRVSSRCSSTSSAARLHMQDIRAKFII